MVLNQGLRRSRSQCRLRAAGAVLVVALTAPWVEAQSAPTFRADVNAVRLDLRVTTEDGAFVRGLTRDDVMVLEDGVPQSLTTFSLVDLPLTPTLSTTALTSSDVSTNTSFRDGRVYLLVLDDLHVHEQREVTIRQLAQRFLTEYATPADRVAVATLSGSHLGTQQFSNNYRDLLDAVDRFHARTLAEAVFDGGSLFDAARTRTPEDPPPSRLKDKREVIPLESLLSLVDWLGTIPDRRKALVFISEGVPDRADDPDVIGTFRQIWRTAAQSNIAIYAVDAVGVPGQPAGAVKPVATLDDDRFSDKRRELRAGLRLLAEETGGVAVLDSNAFDSLFQRVVVESSTYYMVGYSSSNSPSQKLRKIEVQARRPELKVQARRTASPLTGRQSRRVAPPSGVPRELGSAFQSPVPLTGHDLAVVTLPRRGNGEKANVPVIIEGRGAEPLDLYVAAAQTDGTIRAFQRGKLSPERGTAPVMTTATTLDLKPGRYHLRVAAHQPTSGSTASVLHDFEVPDFSKAPLSIGGMTLIDVARGRSPLMRRVFTTSESLELAASLYWRRQTTDRIHVVTTIRNQRGEDVYRQAGEIDPGTRAQTGVDVSATIALASLQPGTYELRVQAQTQAANPVTAARSLTLSLVFP